MHNSSGALVIDRLGCAFDVCTYVPTKPTKPGHGLLILVLSLNHAVNACTIPSHGIMEIQEVRAPEVTRKECGLD